MPLKVAPRISDKLLLDYLDDLSDRGFVWLARRSTTGRGYRLHQEVAERGWTTACDGCGPTAREALADAITTARFRKGRDAGPVPRAA